MFVQLVSEGFRNHYGIYGYLAVYMRCLDIFSMEYQQNLVDYMNQHLLMEEINVINMKKYKQFIKRLL